MRTPTAQDLTPILGPHGGKILLVEDDLDTRRTLDQLLTEVGFDVKCAANGAEAIELLEADAAKPQLIMLDIWMPHMDGLDFRARQLSIPDVKDIPVIVMTAAGLREEARQLRFARILRKPLDEVTVLEAVREFIPGPVALDP
jgi:CheY-like chemotaxis protein